MLTTEVLLMFGVVLLLLLTFIISFYSGARFSVNLLLDHFLSVGFDARVDDFVSCNKYVELGNIVFVGDSLMQQYNTYEYFDKLKTYNRGIGGDDTAGLIERIKESIFDLAPSQVVLLIGTNDLGYGGIPPEKIVININEIISLINESLPKTKIHLISLLPVNDKVDKRTVRPRTNKNIDLVNNSLSKLHPKIYIDLNKHFTNSNNKLDKRYTSDGLHLNNLGYELLTKLLLKILK